MILIFSKEDDESTNLVIDELGGGSYKRINSITLSKCITINERENFTIDEFIQLVRRADCFYFRKRPRIISKSKDKKVSFIQMSEFEKIFKHILFLNRSKTTLGSWDQDDINRLIVSKIAEEIGVLVPKDGFISSKKEYLTLIRKTNSKYITKNVGVSIPQKIDHDIYYPLTSIIDSETLPNLFFPSYVQEFIDKEFDIRSFYLDGKFYSTAIFSQNDSQTKVDYRNYNYDTPARQVRFNLPKSIEQKTALLCKKLKINTASIDFVKAKNGNEIFFLEINPSGQFGNLSHTGNYGIEKLIAQWLTLE